MNIYQRIYIVNTEVFFFKNGFKNATATFYSFTSAPEVVKF